MYPCASCGRDAADPKCSVLMLLQAVASCSRLTSLQLADKYHDPHVQLDNESWVRKTS
jgi:hypothetical protein